MLEKLFLASKYFNLYKKAQGFTLILAIILTVVTTAVNASTSYSSSSANADLTLAATQDQADFSLSLSPDTLNLKQGEKGILTLTNSNPSIGNLSLSISGLPTGTTAILSTK